MNLSNLDPTVILTAGLVLTALFILLGLLYGLMKFLLTAMLALLTTILLTAWLLMSAPFDDHSIIQEAALCFSIT